MNFEVNQWNRRRALRGSIPLEMKVIYDDENWGYLWMTEKHLQRNIREYGRHPELLRGLQCYQEGKLVKSPSSHQEVEV